MINPSATAAYMTKAVTFKANADSLYAGRTRYLASKVSPTGRASHWCCHYHPTEAQAISCGINLVGAAIAPYGTCPECKDFYAWCPDHPELHQYREGA